MKKIFLFAALFLAFIGCKEETVVPDMPETDAISVTPESKIFTGGNGGSVSVVVTSSGEWTLKTKNGEDYSSWISVDCSAGKDGDVVKFTVEQNNQEDKTAEFIFVCGEEEAPFTIKSFRNEIEMELLSDENVSVDYTEGRFDILLSISDGISYRDIKCSVQQDETWLSEGILLDGDEPNTAKVGFEYPEYEKLDGPRTAEVTIGYDGLEPIVVSVEQKPEHVLKAEQTSYKLTGEAGTLVVSILSSVEYSLTLGEGSEWLTDQKADGDTYSWSYGEFPEGKREAVITLTETNPAEGMEPLVSEIKVIQSNFLISVAADMTQCHATVEEWDNPDVLKFGKTITVEMLLYRDWSSKGADLFGIPGIFTIRCDSDGIWDVNYALNETDIMGAHRTQSVNSFRKELDNGGWTHIAVVFSPEEDAIWMYQDGSFAYRGFPDDDMMDIDLTAITKDGGKFCIGAFDGNNSFEGYISEVRVWNRALPEAEINANKNAYVVPADSEGLVAYWKLDDGTGNVIKDYTSNGNDLIGEYFNAGIWEPGMEWVDVELP